MTTLIETLAIIGVAIFIGSILFGWVEGHDFQTFCKTSAGGLTIGLFWWLALILAIPTVVAYGYRLWYLDYREKRR